VADYRPSGPVKGAGSAALWFCLGVVVLLVTYALLPAKPDRIDILRSAGLAAFAVAVVCIGFAKIKERTAGSSEAGKLLDYVAALLLGIFLSSYALSSLP
jgi:hypothetical protein